MLKAVITKKWPELADRRTDARWLEEKFQTRERRVCGLLSIAMSSFRYCSRRSNQDLKQRLTRWPERSALWLPEVEGVDRAGGRTSEPQASVPGVSRGGAISEAKKAQALRPQRLGAPAFGHHPDFLHRVGLELLLHPASVLRSHFSTPGRRLSEIRDRCATLTNLPGTKDRADQRKLCYRLRRILTRRSESISYLTIHPLLGYLNCSRSVLICLAPMKSGGNCWKSHTYQ
jgi:hypothetical protein